MFGENHLEIIKKVFVNNGEYAFKNEKDAERFAKELLGRIEDLYQDEHYYREYENFSDFIYTSHADNEAFHLYDDGDY